MILLKISGGLCFKKNILSDGQEIVLNEKYKNPEIKQQS